MSKIARAPRRPPANEPHDPLFWDKRDLEGELRRAFQICHECRMCVTYCGSFPSLFQAVDREIDAGRAEGAETINDADIRRVTDLCWQCKLCYIKCPYTADEKAYELLDFPRILARARAVEAKSNGVPLVDQVLGEPALIGQLGAGATAPVANLVNSSRLLRKVAEKVTGVSSEFPLPPLDPQPFSRWFGKHTPLPGAGEAGEVVLFATCYGEYNFPAIARAAVRVLEHQGFSVLLPEQTCCGLPNLDGGDLAAATSKMQANVDSLLPLIKGGRKVVTFGPSCGYTIRKEWPSYLRTAGASEVAAGTLDLMEFLEKLRREKKLKKDFSRGFGKVAYHAPCHQRAQKIGTPGARLLGLLPDTSVEVISECSAVDGTWGMKAEFYEMGRRYARRLVQGVDEAGAQLVVSDCSLAALRINQENGCDVLHPVEALALGYGLEGGRQAGAPHAEG